MNYLIVDFFNIFILGVIISIAVYHFFIFIGRREEKSNFYFALFAFSVWFFVFVNSMIFFKVFQINNQSSIQITKSITASILAISFSFFGYNFLSLFYEYNRKNKIINLLICLQLIDSIVIILSIIIFGIQFYSKHIFVYTISISVIVMLSLISFFVYWIIKEKKYKKRTIAITLAGLLLILLNITTGRVLEAFDIPNPLSGNFFVLGIAIYVYAYALSYNFNSEHYELKNKKKELEYLNLTLEEKVKERTAQLEIANKEIEETIKQKTHFFINIAHETKTPLTLILNYLDKYIKSVGLNEDLKVIQQNIYKLLQDMINFLDLEKLQKGSFIYDNTQITNFSDVLKRKLVLFVETANNKQISLSFYIEENIFAKADVLGIERIINNLVENAIKYTEENGKIEISLKKIDENIEFVVRDTGIGISKEFLEHIFLPFYQISQKKRNIDGIGMGLFIVKKIIESLNGDILVESYLTQGTQFKVILKNYELKENDIVAKDLMLKSFINIPVIKDTNKDIKFDKVKNTIILVEDNLDLLFYVVSILTEKYNVFYFRNGKEALENIKKIEKPDIIISDIMMDEMDGYTFFNILSKDEKLKDIPFIFLTAKTSLADKIEGLARGAVEYIFKPFVAEELILRIDSLIRIQNLKHALYEKNKFATVGKLVSNISHEISNPIFGIKGPLDYLKEEIYKTDLKENSYINEAIHYIYNNLNRVEEIIKNFKFLYYTKNLIKNRLYLKPIILDIIKVFKNNVKNKKIEYVIDIRDDFEINGNDQVIKHISINLLSNSIDAISSNGTVKIVGDFYNETPIIKFMDNGCGIKEEDISNIFDILYTTKDIGKGTGLGLYIVKDLISKLNWDLKVTSKINEGTSFTIFCKDN